MKNIFSKKSVRIISVVLAALLVTGGVVSVVYASAGKKADINMAALNSSLSDVVKITDDTAANLKEETVYALGDANGNISKTIVSEWLKNPSGADTISDYTELADIKNTNGNETFTSSGANAYVWKAGGKDIHYQGTTTKQLPVTVKVTYLLNGSEVKPSDIAGKSGHVTIRFDYTNTQTVNANVDGKTEQINVPFMMVSGVILNTDTFSNVKVSNGSVYNDGTRDVVFGYALPGVPKSLDIKKGDLDIPENVEIEADTTSFSLDGTLTVGVTGLLNNIKVNTDSDISKLSDSLDDLKDAANKLVDGTSDLYDGCEKLYDKTGELEDGVSTLLSGAKDLKSGAGDLNSGIGSLRDGLAELSKNSDSLNNGAKDIIDEIFATATTQLRVALVSGGLMTADEAKSVTLTRSNYLTVFGQLESAAIAKAEAGLRAQLSAGGMASKDLQDLTITIAYDLMSKDSSLSYTSAVTKAIDIMKDAGIAQTACSVINAAWLADANNQALIAGIMGAGITSDSSTAAKIAAVAEYLSPTDPMSKLSDAGTILSHAAVAAATAPSDKKIAALCTAIASTGNAQLDAVKDQLSDVMKFYNGLLSYTGGVDSAYAGSKKLASGASTLAGGAKDLYDGVSTLYAGSKKLVSGVGDLKDGSEDLKDGMKDFYDDGIEKLVDKLGGDYSGIIDRLGALTDASRGYKSFAGITNGMSGSVKFIYRTDSIDK